MAYRRGIAKISKRWGWGGTFSSGEDILSVNIDTRGIMKNPKRLLERLISEGLTNKKATRLLNQRLLVLGRAIRDRANERAPDDTGNLKESAVVVTANPMLRDDHALPAVRHTHGRYPPNENKRGELRMGRPRERRNRVDEADRSYKALRRSLLRGGNEVKAGVRVSYAAEYALLVHENVGKPPLRNPASAHFLEFAVQEFSAKQALGYLVPSGKMIMQAMGRSAKRME